MTILLSSPEPSGSWKFFVEERDDKNYNLKTGCRVAVDIAEALGNYNLLTLSQLELSWRVKGVGSIGFGSRIACRQPLDVQMLVDKIIASQPRSHPESYATDFELVGIGEWLDHTGFRRREPRLVEASISPDSVEVWAEIRVHHDIWSWYSFSGVPHPEVYEKNAPRLEKALRGIEHRLGTEIVPGDPTYFGAPEKYGIETPPPEEDGKGFDATSEL